jgi:acetylornithine deacetylase/succinyl-diaminopimelate desuccinylase-like protein
LNLRKGGHHSGNWGGLLANPGIILSHALASMVDRNGRILIPALRPPAIPQDIRQALARLTVTGEGGPAIDTGWGESGLTPAEKVYGWSTFEVLAFTCGNPDAPVNAIPPGARARCHIRFTADMDPATFIPAVRTHLDENGFADIRIRPMLNNYGRATRMSPDHPWVKFATASFEKTLVAQNDSRQVAFLPNLGGTIPNDAFSDILGLPTLWVPHSYGGCSQHAPNEHLLESIVREGLQLMTGLFWDLANGGKEGIHMHKTA